MKENTKISKVRLYLFGIIDTLAQTDKYQINVDMLSNNIDDYSLDKMPVGAETGRWIIGVVKKREVYSFRSRKAYSKDTINNLNNMGFFEEFEKKINSNNKQGIRPEIDGIESIRILNPNTMTKTNGTTAEFDCQIEITYREV